MRLRQFDDALHPILLPSQNRPDLIASIVVALQSSINLKARRY